MINTLENFSKFDLNIIAYDDDNIYNEHNLEDLHKINKVSIFEIYDKYKNDEFVVDIIENMKFFTILYYKEKYNMVKEILDPNGSVYNIYGTNTYSKNIYDTKYMICYNYRLDLNDDKRKEIVDSYGIKNLEDNEFYVELFDNVPVFKPYFRSLLDDTTLRLNN